MTQKQLAGRVGISRQTMNAIENCNHAPKIDVAIRIADVFGVLVDEMFELNYDGKPERRPKVTPAAPTQPVYRSGRAPQASIKRVEPIQPVEQSSTKKAPQDQKALLASLRNLVS